MIQILHRKVSSDLEYRFYLETTELLTERESSIVNWLLAETYSPENLSVRTFFPKNLIIEVGPRLNFATAWNTNALSILRACGITKVSRIERSRRYVLPKPVSGDELIEYITKNCGYDRMTEMIYTETLTTFETGIKPEAVYTIPLMEEGTDALRRFCKKFGIPMDEHDIMIYDEYFVRKLKRNPTNVEIVDLGNANSEHSRHGYFKGHQIFDGIKMPETLMDIVKSTLKANPRNSVLAFRDNSSVIRGYEVKTIIPYYPSQVSAFSEREPFYHILFTAETHNFPSGVAPFPGAETGTGGRIRDVQATGRGALVIAGTAAYCVGNLLVSEYDLPWEDKNFVYPRNLASPLKILIDASNGASDYGNKFGEPVIQGFVKSFGLKLPNGERREWIKPIMFTGGVGQIENLHLKKGEAEESMVIVQVGGLAYRIGFGGGAASSMIQGENIEELDFNAVQRGDAEMEQKMNRVIRACIERWHKNPIVSVHDQGAGGPANVLKELVEKAGGRVYIDRINLGDPTLSILEIWVCEYQERNGMLIYKNRLEEFRAICAREKVPCEVLGEVTGDGKFTVYALSSDESEYAGTYTKPVELDLADVLGNMPQKTFSDTRVPTALKPLEFPKDLTVREALDRVLRLVSVGSKRFLTSKVDRSVTGLIAQQQCVGPLQLTLSNVAVIAQSHFPNEKGKYTGAAIAIGERPIIGLINPAAQGRMTVAEMLTNIVWAKLSSLEDIKCSGNWMWAPKLPGEGAKLYDAAVAMRNMMVELGIAVDGGKDSLSMATIVKENGELVKSPGQLVISGYCTMPDAMKVIMPDIKNPDGSLLVFFGLAGMKQRLGGSALAHVFGQIGNDCPDVEDSEDLKNAFKSIQEAIDANLILSGHDKSDGGLIVTLLEMAFAGNCGFSLGYITDEDPIAFLFNEELGLVLEFGFEEYNKFVDILKKYNLQFHAKMLGYTQKEKRVRISCYDSAKKEDVVFLEEDMRILRGIWEETSYQLDRLQANPECVDEEKENIFDRLGISYKISFDYRPTPKKIMALTKKPKVAIIREEGSNGDREMTSAFHQAGFECWDVTMTDLLEDRITLENFRGVAFVGGFSYADVLDSAKGWSGVIRFNEKLKKQFDRFYERPDTFSLGVCNGCQLMALLGRVPFKGLPDKEQPRFIRNTSGRFESRWARIKIFASPAIMLKGMEESILGIWVAHGEGRAYFPRPEMLDKVREKLLAPIRYIDDRGYCTEIYPFNPNGSPMGIAALCSPDGRHLAIMPHPERSFLKWQWGFQSESWKKDADQTSPWLKMFQNAREWCEKTK